MGSAARRRRTASGPRAWPRVGAMLDYATPAGHALLAGIARYASLHGPWTIRTHPRGGFASLALDEPFVGEGMIAHANPFTLPGLRRLACPVVNVSGLVIDNGLPSVIPDSLSVGRLAAEHLIEHGFRTLGFCGFAGHGYSDLRQRGAAEVAEQRGATFDVYPQPEAGIARQGTDSFLDLEQANLLVWLARLPKPTGVICANDMRARQLLAACQRGRVAVPEQVAIIGADNDELLCDTALPPLSSVAINFELLGHRAAELLDRLMRRERAPAGPILLTPTGVIERQSTDVMAIRDAEVALALRHIRETALDSDMTIEQVLDDVPISRRSMERRFAALLGRTPHQELVRVRVDAARRLLASTDLSMPHVAARSGFSSAARLSVVFKRETGQTPSTYRQAHRARAADGSFTPGRRRDRSS